MKDPKQQLESEEFDINDEELYTVEWSDIEKAEIEYENYLNDVENFFTDSDSDSDDETKFNPGVI